MIQQLLERWKRWYGLTDSQARMLMNDRRIIDHANYIEPLLRESSKKRVEYAEPESFAESIDYVDMTFVELLSEIGKMRF